MPFATSAVQSARIKLRTTPPVLQELTARRYMAVRTESVDQQHPSGGLGQDLLVLSVTLANSKAAS